MCNSVQDFQNNFNQYLTEQVQKVFGSQIGANFRAFQHSGGFNYFTNDGINYNHLSLPCLDSLLKQDATGEYSLEEGGFSKLYYDVLKTTRYTLSQNSQQKVNDSLMQSAAQAREVIQLYPKKLPPLTAENPNDRIIEIYENCAEALGGDVTQDCSIIPDRSRTFKVALQELNNMAEEAAQLVMNVGNKNTLLANILKNMAKPEQKSGGLPLDNGNFYVGYDKIPTPNELLGSLNTSKNQLTISVSGETYNGTEMHMHMDNQGDYIFPLALLINVIGVHQSHFDMDKLKTNQTNFSAQITYTGLTKVPIQPQPADITGKNGWYAETAILNEIKEKSENPDVDGYHLQGTEFDVKTLFGQKLACLKALLISQMPSITITMSNINMEYAKSVFSMENDVFVTLFGFITIGHHHNYSETNVCYNEEQASVTITFQQPNVSGTPDPQTAHAFIMGGVPYYPGM